MIVVKLPNTPRHGDVTLFRAETLGEWWRLFWTRGSWHRVMVGTWWRRVRGLRDQP